MTAATDALAAPPFVGREAELDALCGLVAGGPERVAVVRGEPGIGKTELLERVTARAAVRTVRVAGSEEESHLPFATLADLVHPVEDQLAALPEVQREALEVSVARRAGRPSGPLAVCAAVLGLLEAVGEREGLLVVVDDLQWVDPPSAEVLLFVARRLRSPRVSLVFATRDERRVVPGALVVDVGRLSGTESRELLHRLTGELAPTAVDRLVVGLAGHPLALVENARHLGPAVPPRAGPALEALWSAALEALPTSARTAVTVLAAAGSAGADEVDLVLADLGLAAHDLQPAEEAGLLRVHEGRPDLRHPLLRPVLLAADPALTRRVHEALAARTTGIRRAWHRAARIEGTDDVVGEQLAVAARSAAERGGHGSAGEAWARSAQLSTDRWDRADRLLAAAREFLLAGSLDLAAGHAEAALALDDDDAFAARAEIVRSRATTWLGDPGRAADDLVRAAERVAPEDPAAAAALYTEATAPAAMAGRVRDILALVRTAASLAPTGTPVRRAPEAHALVLIGEPSSAVDILDSLGDEPGAMPWDLQDEALRAQIEVFVERYVDAHRRIDALLAAARRHGAGAMLAFAHTVRADVELWRGRWPAARADAVEALQWAEERGERGTAALAMLVLARLDAMVGDVDRSRARTRRVLAEIGSHGVDCLLTYVPAVEGLAALAVGEAEDAVGHLERAHRRAIADGLGASNVVPYGPDLVEALVRSGAPDRAREVLAWWEDKAGTGLAFPAATAARCRGILATCDDDAADAFASAHEAHARSDQPFERARTLLAEAESLRRLRRPAVARTAARDAHALFVGLGARPWTARAEAELAAAGAPPPRRADRETVWSALTPQEFQVARVVAEGRTNDEAAAALFVSRKTVENHLTRVYRKLGMRSRSDLVRLFPGAGIVPAPELA